MAELIPIAFVLVLVVALASSSVQRLRKDERAVVFRLGKVCSPPRGPGVVLVAPLIDKVVRVGLRPFPVELPRFEGSTRDGVRVHADASADARVFDPEAAIMQAESFHVATGGAVERTLREVVAERSAAEVTGQTREVESVVLARSNEAARRWGVELTNVELRFASDEPRQVLR